MERIDADRRRGVISLVTLLRKALPMSIDTP
jgi:hypothetical protein